MPVSANLSFDLLFQSHQRELLKFAGQHSNDEIAEDLVQEAYIRLIRQAQTEKIDNPRAYLFKVTHNLSIDYLRQGQVRSHYVDCNDIDLEHIADSRPEPEADVESQVRLQHCLDALNSLPEIYRHVFLLHRFDGMTYIEIGETLQIPARTVERYAVKAFAHCFAKLQDSD
ncbi:MAG: RNA polymerase sigma factor [Methyloglobulus sp.]|nr:RNA polymerase sigma factor [Methyloglobulus sp.]